MKVQQQDQSTSKDNNNNNIDRKPTTTSVNHSNKDHNVVNDEPSVIPKQLCTNLPFLLNGDMNILNHSIDELKFICDGSLGRLVKHLRMLGCDCAYERDANSHYLLYLARSQDRIILTKNRAMIKHMEQIKRQHLEKIKRLQRKRFDREMGCGSNAIKKDENDATKAVYKDDSWEHTEKQELFNQWVKSREELKRKHREARMIQLENGGGNGCQSEQEEESEEEEWEDELDMEEDEFYEHKYYHVQSRSAIGIIDEVVNVFRIPYEASRIFSKCLKCNSGIETLAKEAVKGKVYETVYNEHNRFYRCLNCEQIYWKGQNNYSNAKNFSKVHSFHATPTATVSDAPK